ncbi:hypothetical protein SUGI_0232450 [Cryptomeria japonica]|uniref:putative disease resistance protein RGA4 n=1 Tax=Cryptomeria japonica TaxID=3369 RepID=UPI002408A011|nr:putative disease resistance protein RGA4 [Cryptomeria japonica]GLJ14388.1 hypothetical protein SUGI_0232450 [Cryptomeria japonica]
MVEGFVPAGDEQWDMAWDWLYQLAELCLLQLWEDVKEYDATDQIKFSKYCKIHDVLHDLAIHISRENKCAFSVEEASTCTIGASGWSRILLAKKDINVDNIFDSQLAYIRTFSLSQNREITSLPSNLFTHVRGLRILDLSYTSISTLPESAEKNTLLKVLDLRGTEIKQVPECVRHLKSLLFLAMPNRCKYLPPWIGELKCLQHLECEGVHRMPKTISKLASLRKLQSGILHLSIEEDEFIRLEDLANMTQLQELELTLNHEMQLKMVEEGILSQLLKMRQLFIRNCVDDEMGRTKLPRFSEKMRAMENLESLRLIKFEVPRWICDLWNLRELELCNCDCSDCPELQTMPNLVRLKLSGNDRCIELPKALGKSGEFPYLYSLSIQFFEEQEEVRPRMKQSDANAGREDGA